MIVLPKSLRISHAIGAVVMMSVVVAPRTAVAQGVGSGPLTTTLADTEPTSGVLSFARMKLAPGIVIREIGWDDNVFDEADRPKEDYVASVMPDVSVFSRLRFVQVSAYAGADLNYYKKYVNERSAGYSLKGRIDLLLSRVSPFIGVGSVEQRTRPNGEIDVRADRDEKEITGGVAFDLSQYASVFAAVNVYHLEFRDAFEESVNLAEALSRDSPTYSVGVRSALTPLLTMTVNGSYGEDNFKKAPLRNTQTYAAQMALRFAPEAVVTGALNVGYRDFKPVDPLVDRFRGITGSVAMSYSFLEVARVGVTGTRAIEFSFNQAEAYYIDNTITGYYTHRLFGDVDAQARAGRSLFDYGHRQNTPPHRDTLDTVGASIGYNLPNRTRISVNYENARRRSPVFPERNYQRRRAFLSWAFAF